MTTKTPGKRNGPKWWRKVRYETALWLHIFRSPSISDRRLGRGAVRQANVRILLDRWFANTPKPKDYGL